MVAIVAGQSLGLSNTSLGVLGGAGQLGAAGQGRSGEGVYVNASTGNLVVQQQDEWLVGLGPDAGIVRTYNSLGGGGDDNGDNWRLGVSRRVRMASGSPGGVGSTAVRVGEDGWEIVYSWDATRALYVSRSGGGGVDTLSHNAGVWTWIDGDTGTKEFYEAVAGGDWRLGRVEDRAGNQLKLTYASATSYLVTQLATWSASTASGETVTITYDPVNTGDILSITTRYQPQNDVKRVSYTYETYDTNKRRLKTVTVDLTPRDQSDNATSAATTTYTTTYSYTDTTNKRLASIAQSDGSLLEFGYDASLRVNLLKETVNGQPRETAFDYSVAGMTKVTDALGQVTELFYETATGENKGQLKQITGPTVNGARPTTKFQYDDKGNVTKVTDANNRETVYGYDANGNRVYERNAQGNVVERVYSGTNLLLQETSYTVNDTDGLGTGAQPAGALTQRYVYDSKGNLRFAISPMGDVVEYRYNLLGQREAELRYTSASLDLSTLNTVLSDFTTGPGGLSALTAPVFEVVDGQLQIKSKNQTDTVWTGVNATATQPMGTAWRMEFTTPAGSDPQLVMQTGLQTGSYGNANYRRHFMLVSGGKVYATVFEGATPLATRELGPVKRDTTYVLEFQTTPDGASVMYVYEKGRERASGVSDARTFAGGWTGGAAGFSIQSYSGAQAATVGMPDSTVIIRVDNLSIEKTLESVLTSWTSGKLSTAQRTDYTYNTRGQLDTLKTYASVDVNGVGLSDGTHSTTQYVYDQAGNLLQKIDGRNNATVYTYDGLNRITSVKDPASQQTSVTTYVDSTLQTKVTLLNNVLVTSTYDQAGRLVSVTQADGNTALGTTSYTYDKLGRLTSVTQPTGEKCYFVYDALGRKIGEIDGEGGLTEYQYDASGQVTRTVGYTNKVSSTMIAALLEGKAGLPVNLASSVMTSWGLSLAPSGTAIVEPTGLLEGEQTRSVQQPAGAAAGAAVLSSASMAVTAGQRYDVSVYTGATNASVTLTVEYYNGATKVSTSAVLSTNAAEKAGGPALTDYKRLQGFVDIPQTGVTHIKVVLTKASATNSAALSRMTIARPLVTPVQAQQATAALADLRPAAASTTDRAAWNVYDNAGRLSKTVTAASTSISSTMVGNVVEYRYDGAGRMIDKVEYGSQLIGSPMSALQSKVLELKSGGDGVVIINGTSYTIGHSPVEDRRTRYFYDANGRLTGQLDALNYYTENQYDKAGQLTRTTRYARALVGTMVEGGAAPKVYVGTSTDPYYIQTQATNGFLGGADQTTHYIYNARGQLKAVIDAELYATAYEYDKAGNKTKETRYEKTVFSSAGSGRVTLGTIKTSETGAVLTRYVQASANDRITTYGYDEDNRLERVESQPTGLVTTYDYDVSGNLLTTTVGLTPSEQRVTRKLYDKLGRVTHELDAVGSEALAAATPAQEAGIWAKYATRYVYAENGGFLLARITPNGTDGTGLKTVYYYDRAGRVTNTINALGEVSSLVYNSFGDVTEQRRHAKRLSGVSGYAGGAKTTSVAAALAALAPSGDAVITNSYNRQGLLSQRVDEVNESTDFLYNAFGEQNHVERKVTYAGGLTTEIAYDRRGQIIQTQERDEDTVLLRTHANTYDAFGRLKSSTDANGVIRDYYFDKLGRDLFVCEPGNPDLYATITQDAFGRTTEIQDPQGNSTTYTYDDTARTMMVTSGGVSTITSYDRLGQTVQVRDGRGNLTKYEYDKNGQITNIKQYAANGTAVEGAGTSTQYDAAGRVFSTTDARGTVTRFEYDQANRVLKRIDDHGGLNLTSEYRYDALGNTAWSKDAAGVWTQTQFDQKGRARFVTVDPTQVPGGAATEANPFGLVGNPAGANALNQTTEFTYAPGGLVKRVIRGVGSSRPETTEYQYDDLDRRVKEILDPDGLKLATTYTYDGNSQVVARTDALGHVTRYVYSVGGRLTHVIDPTGAVVQTDYDTEGRVSRTVAYAQRIAPATLATLPLAVTASQIQALLPSAPGATDQASQNVYNVLGQLTWSFDALGYATQREYDASGNLARETRYAKKPVFDTTGLVEADRRTFSAPTWANAADVDDKAVDQYVYDAANRLAWHIDAMGYATQTQYSDGGRTLTVTQHAKAVVYPAGQSLLGIGTQAPKVLAAAPSPVTEPYVLSDAQDRSTETRLDAMGRTSTVKDAMGYVTKWTYDAVGRAKTQTRFTAEASATQNEADTKNAITRYDYDAAGNLVKSTDAENVATVSQYDAVGRLKTRTVADSTVDAAVTRYDYDAAGRQIQVTDALDVVTRKQYDKAGRVTDVTLAHGTDDASRTHYVYDDAGHLLEEARGYQGPDQATTRYVVDAFGQRVEIIDPRGVELAEGTSLWAQSERQRLTGIAAAPLATSIDPVVVARYKSLLARYTTKQVFDQGGHVIKSTDPLGGNTLTDYDAFGNAVKVTDPNGNPGQFFFDKNSRPTWNVDPMGYAVYTEYDAFGQVIRITRFANSVQGPLSVGIAPKPVTSELQSQQGGISVYVIADTNKDSVTQIQHDKLGNQTKIIDAEGYSEVMFYDSFGHKLEYTNKLNGKYTYTYDKTGHVLTETAPEKAKELDASGLIKLNSNGQPTDLSVVTRFEYDKRGNVKKKIEAEGLLSQQRITQFTYDLLDRLKTTTQEPVSTFSVALGEQGNSVVQESRWYDARGNLIEVRSPDGGRTLMYWDALDRKVSEVSPIGVLKQWDYADDGKVVEQRVYDDLIVVAADARGGVRPQPLAANVNKVRQLLYVYDANHRLTKTVVPSVMVGEINPQTGNYEVSIKDLTSHVGYDANGNVISETDARGNTSWRFYDRAGQEVVRVDAERYVTTWERDSAGNISRQVRYAKPLGGQVVLNTNTLPGQITAAVQSDDRDRILVQVNDRMGRVKESRVFNVQAYVLNDLGHANLTKPDGKDTAVTRYDYNGLGQVIQREEATGEKLNWDFDKQGRQVTAWGSEFKPVGWQVGDALQRQRTDTEYNALGLTIRQLERGTNDQSEQDDRVTLFAYGKNGRLERRIDAMGVVTNFKYDVAGRATVRWLVRYDADHLNPATDITSYEYDATGQQTATAMYSLNGAGAFFTSGNVANHAALHKETVGYNTHGQLTSKSVNGGGQQFVTYDKAGHAIKSNGDSGATKAYVFDANGNVTLSIMSTGVDLQALSLVQILQREDLFSTASVYSARNLLTDSYEIRDVEARGASGSTGWESLTLADLGSAGQVVSIDAASVAPSNAGTVDLMSRGSFSGGSITISSRYEEYLSGNLSRRYWSGGYQEAHRSESFNLLVDVPDLSGLGGDGLYFELSQLNEWGPMWGGNPPDWVKNDYNEKIWIDPNPGFYSGTKLKVEVAANILHGSVLQGTLKIYKMVNGVRVDVSGPMVLTVDATAAQSKLTLQNGGQVAPVLNFKDQPVGASRLVLSYRGKGSDGPWKVVTLSNPVIDPVSGTPAFALVSSQITLPPNSYEMRYVALTESGDILNSGEGSLEVTQGQITATQLPSALNGGIRAFFDTDGHLNFMGQGGNSAHSTFVATNLATQAVQTFALDPAVIDGKSIPGWFRVKADQLALLSASSSYSYVLTCLGFDESTVTSKLSGYFQKGGNGFVASSLTLSLIQSPQSGVKSIGGFDGNAGITGTAVVNYDISSRISRSVYRSGGIQVGTVEPYDSVEGYFSVNLPNLAALGGGEIIAEVVAINGGSPMWTGNPRLTSRRTSIGKILSSTRHSQI